MNPVPASAYSAAEMLEGVQLPGGWKVLSKVPRSLNATGGAFSVSYFVEQSSGKKKRRAFLKALNFHRLAGESDFSAKVQEHITIFNFERDTLTLCKDRKLRRVALILDAQEYRMPNNPFPVCYIIFELAEGGDARKQLERLGMLNVAWNLRTLHQIAVGLKQLHGEGIAHQDLKPSNVIFCEDIGAKLTDLGSADMRQNPSGSPRGHFAFAGDGGYTPPELLYNELSPDWQVRRLGCDLYMLGSLIVFFFTGGAALNAVLRTKIDPVHSHLQWPHDYRTVLPYIRNAFEEALEDITQCFPERLRPELLKMVRWLCEPDPRIRGHPTDLKANQFSLERIISRLDFLAYREETGL